MTVGVISLGCDKNRVDTETIMTSCARFGFDFCDSYEDADVLIVNTCAFLNAAREEAIEAIFDAAAYKLNGKCRCLAVAGCLPMRYLQEIKEDLPEVDLFLLPDQYETAGELIADKVGAERDCRTVSSRLLTTPEHYAYLKIADGCDNKCTFCMIPSIRGAYRSESTENVVCTAQKLAQKGVKELILVAQDTTRYGVDRPEYGTLAALIGRVTAIDGIETVRILYCYPECVTDELIEVFRTNEKVAPYIDIPLQHASDAVLKRMNRRSTQEDVRRLIAKLRAAVPDIAIRTTMMVGFPGETEEDVDTLCAFLQDVKLDNVGFFTYSLEEETPSAKIGGHVAEDVKRARLERVAAVQQQVVLQKMRANLGEKITVRYEGVDFDRQLFIGRPVTSAPEIDPLVYFGAKNVQIGQNYDVTLTGIDAYDYIGTLED